jgi:AcrR family transcriptional regulator
MGIAERKERERERRRNDILDAAEEVIFKQGIDHATMDAIAEKAELSKATLYLYFESKEEIYFAIFLRGRDKLFELVTNNIENIADIQLKLKTYLSTVMAFKKKYPNYFDAIFYFMIRDINVNKESEYFRQHKENNMMLLNKWVELIEQGKSQGQIRKDLNPVSVAIIMWIQLIGFLKTYPMVRDKIKDDLDVTEDSLLEDYYDLFLHSINTK